MKTKNKIKPSLLFTALIYREKERKKISNENQKCRRNSFKEIL